MKGKSKKKNKKKKIKIKNVRNLHLYWIAVFTFFGSIIGILCNFQSKNKDEKHAAKMTELKTKISSIERNIGKNDYFDVKQLFITENSRNKPSPNSSYITNGNFYADTTNLNWTYKQIPPVTFYKNLLNITPLEFQLIKNSSLTIDSIFNNPVFIDYKKRCKIHQFKYNDSLIININGKHKSLNSSINVIIIKKKVAKVILKIINQSINYDKKLIKNFDIDTIMANQIIKTAEKQFEKNSSSLIFNLILNGIVYSSLSGGDLLKLQSVQKKSEVFYTRYTREYDIDPKKIFETGEIFFADRNDKIYIVTVKIIDYQPLIGTELAADINNWLFSLKLL